MPTLKIAGSRAHQIKTKGNLMESLEQRLEALEKALSEQATEFARAFEALVDRTDFVEGQLMGIQASIRAAISASPTPDETVSRIAAEMEKLSAIALQSENSDEYLRGIAWARECVLPPKRRKPST
jgi:hypothetical protein